MAETLASRFGRLVSQSIDGASFQYGERAKFYMDLAVRLRAQNASALGTISISGISSGEMDSVKDDTDRVPSAFEIGQHDDHG
jgi:hypothetical protein